MGKPRGPHRDLATELEQTVLDHMPPPRSNLRLPVFSDREARLQGLLQAMRALVCEFDGGGRMTYASSQVEAILGFTPEELLARGIEFHPEDRPAVIALGRDLRKSGRPGHNQARIRHKLGHWIWFETSLVGWSPSEGSGFHTVAFARDISALKEAEAARRESEERYRTVAEVTADVIFELDAEGATTYISPRVEEIFGYSPEESVALEPFELVHPDDVDRIRAQIAEEFASGAHAEWTSGRLPLLECRLRHKDGRWLSIEVFGVTYEKASGARSYLGVARDVTEQKNAARARRELEESMQRAQKLESLGVLAGGIAHDFNNLLTPILGAAGLALSEIPSDSPVRQRLLKIQDAAGRAAALTNQMLSYAGQQPLRVERQDLSRLVAGMQELLDASISGGTVLQLELASGLPAVEVEAAQISQVVMNLILNAAESLPDGVGSITVRTGLVQIGEPPNEVLFAENLKAGPHVYFEVIDDGCGMDAESRTRIFEPFFTSKFTGRGLGLAAVAGIARGHGGAIEVESQPGQGSRFRLLLPVAPGATAAGTPGQAPLDGWRATGVALIIDDDEGVRELAEEVLRRTGMTVLAAADGHEGVKLFEQHADSIRVVLLDRTMPSLSGADTLTAIRTIRPGAAVVVVSGYSEERVNAELGGRHLAGFLRKPFLPETLLACVREVVEGR